MIHKYKENAENWINNVRNGDGSIYEWFLLLGLIAAISYLWMQTIKRLVD
jgi:hypothetical protein